MRLVIFGAALAAAALLGLLATGVAAARTPGGTTATGVSREFNPAISVNTLLLGRAADTVTDRAHNGVDLQEAEIQLTSIVDPYWKANLVFAVHPETGHDHGAAEAGDDHGHGGYAGHVEVAYVDGTSLPWRLALRLGKDYLPFGKHVPLHTHQFPFVDAPVAVRTFLGGHVLTEVGGRLSRTLPLPWYSDLTAYAVDGQAEIFAADSRDLAHGARWSNLLDLSPEATLELGGSWLHGPLGPQYLLVGEEAAAHTLAGDLDVWGADVTFKWVSASRSRGPALTVTGEVILPRPDQGAQDPLGWYALARYRFARNWWLGLGAGAADRDLPAHDHHEEEHAEEEHHHDHAALWTWEEVREYKANLTWTPSEFSAIRLEAARYDDQVGDLDEWLFSLQVNFTIGSHPAHLY
jgi:hypothetical protein